MHKCRSSASLLVVPGEEPPPCGSLFVRVSGKAKGEEEAVGVWVWVWVMAHTSIR